mmetsp:Transcript_43367/g.117506  ORF Transcript_43367/g.117506 Transcript_43367/m.117506 type:complete len:205 (+) Transcript_43367:1051-1665(+)
MDGTTFHPFGRSSSLGIELNDMDCREIVIAWLASSGRNVGPIGGESSGRVRYTFLYPGVPGLLPTESSDSEPPIEPRLRKISYTDESPERSVGLDAELGRDAATSAPDCAEVAEGIRRHSGVRVRTTTEPSIDDDHSDLYVSGECGVGGEEPCSEPTVLIVAAVLPVRPPPMLSIEPCFCKPEKPRLPSELLRRLNDPGLEGLT